MVHSIFTNTIANIYKKKLPDVIVNFVLVFLLEKHKQKHIHYQCKASRGRPAHTRLSELLRHFAQHRRGAIKTLTVSTLLGYNELLSHIIANEMSE